MLYSMASLKSVLGVWRLQRLHMRIANKRRGFLHKLPNDYAKRYDAVFLERLRLNNMNKNHYLARYIMDSGWGTFKQILKGTVNLSADSLEFAI